MFECLPNCFTVVCRTQASIWLGNAFFLYSFCICIQQGESWHLSAIDKNIEQSYSTACALWGWRNRGWKSCRGGMTRVEEGAGYPGQVGMTWIGCRMNLSNLFYKWVNTSCASTHISLDQPDLYLSNSNPFATPRVNTIFPLLQAWANYATRLKSLICSTHFNHLIASLNLFTSSWLLLLTVLSHCIEHDLEEAFQSMWLLECSSCDLL